MTLYAVDKVLWRIATRRDDTARGFLTDPASVVDGEDLSSEERSALIARDTSTLYRLGAHPFLLWSCMARLNGLEGGDRRQFAAAYRDAVADHGYPKTET